MLEWNEIQSSHSGLCDRSSAEMPLQEQHVRQLKQGQGGSASKGWRANQAVQTCENSSPLHMTTSSAKAFPVSPAGAGKEENKQHTDGVGKSASARPWQREEMTKRRINHISRRTGCSQGKKCSFCLDVDWEDCDSAVASSLNVCLHVHQVEGHSDWILRLWSLEECEERKRSHVM